MRWDEGVRIAWCLKLYIVISIRINNFGQIILE